MTIFIVLLYYVVSVFYCFALILFCAELGATFMLRFVRFYLIDCVVYRYYCALYRLYYFFLCGYLMFVVCLYCSKQRNEY